MNKQRVAIIGAGLIGKKRAEAIRSIKTLTLNSIYDLNKQAARDFSTVYQCQVADDIDEIIHDSSISLVIIAVPHKFAIEVALKILPYKSILMEKPLGRNFIEAKKIINCAKKFKHNLFVGYNYHFYPHIKMAKKFLDSQKIGTIISSSFVIGHGAMPGYEKTWKMDKELCGGGVILDPGVHFLDLMHWLIGKPVTYRALVNNKGWDVEVEDEAMLYFTFKDGSISHHHYSLNFSENTLAIELVGTKGIIRLNGRGGNYGEMKFSYIPRWFWSTGEKKIVKNFRDKDNSFYDELTAISSFMGKNTFNPNLDSYAETMLLVDNLYGKK